MTLAVFLICLVLVELHEQPLAKANADCLKVCPCSRLDFNSAQFLKFVSPQCDCRRLCCVRAVTEDETEEVFSKHVFENYLLRSIGRSWTSNLFLCPKKDLRRFIRHKRVKRGALFSSREHIPKNSSGINAPKKGESANPASYSLSSGKNEDNVVTKPSHMTLQLPHQSVHISESSRNQSSEKVKQTRITEESTKPEDEQILSTTELVNVENQMSVSYNKEIYLYLLLTLALMPAIAVIIIICSSARC